MFLIFYDFNECHRCLRLICWYIRLTSTSLCLGVREFWRLVFRLRFFKNSSCLNSSRDLLGIFPVCERIYWCEHFKYIYVTNPRVWIKLWIVRYNYFNITIILPLRCGSIPMNAGCNPDNKFNNIHNVLTS